MSCSVLERDSLEPFDRATSSDMIKHNLNDLDNEFEYLFQTLSFLVHDVGWERTNNLLANINKNQQRKDTLSNIMPIPDDFLAEVAMQDIVNADSARPA